MKDFTKQACAVGKNKRVLGLLVDMATIGQVALVIAVLGSLGISAYCVHHRNYKEAVPGLGIAVIGLAALFA